MGRRNVVSAPLVTMAAVFLAMSPRIYAGPDTAPESTDDALRLKRQQLQNALEKRAERRSDKVGAMVESPHTRRTISTVEEGIVFLVHFSSPGYDPQTASDLDVYYCAGGTEETLYTEEEPLKLYDCLAAGSPILFKVSEELELQSTGLDLYSLNLADEIEFDDPDIPYVQYEGPKKKGDVFLTERDIYEENQVWKFDFDKSVWITGNRFPTSKQFCITPKPINGTIGLGSELYLTKCDPYEVKNSKKKKRKKKKKKKKGNFVSNDQKWAFCYTQNICDDAVTPPQFTIERGGCEDSASIRSIDCNDYRRRTVNDETIDDSIRDRLDDGGCNPPSTRDYTQIYELADNEYLRNENIEVSLTGICDNSDMDYELRIYERFDYDDYRCIFEQSDTCSGGTIKEIIESRQTTDDLWIIVTTSDRGEDDNYDLEVECVDGRRLQTIDNSLSDNGRRLQTIDNSLSDNGRHLQTIDNSLITRQTLNCDEMITSRITEQPDDLPGIDSDYDNSDCPGKVTDKDNDEVDEDDLERVWFIVDDMEDGEFIEVETRCNGDAAAEKLKTLFRAYEITNNDSDEDIVNGNAGYRCVAERRLDCTKEDEEKDYRFTYRFLRGRRYMITATGASAACFSTELECE